VYPGDLEVSSGAETMCAIAGRLADRLPDAIVVMAYRKKTPRAAEIAARLAERMHPERTRLVDSVPDLLALLRAATAVVFPVDDLFGKVDLPIVLLESMVLGVPVVALNQGPLAELERVELVSSLDPELWTAALVRLATDPSARQERILEQQDRVGARYAAPVVARAYEDLYHELLARRGATSRRRNVSSEKPAAHRHGHPFA
jgi:phosphatidylinositol alpha-1,6-mannosyltransferase